MKRIIFLIALALSLMGCAGDAKPNVIILTPMSGASFESGQDVAIVSNADDPIGVTKIEMFVDGLLVKTDSTPTGQAQKSFAVQQTWQATTPGSHIIIIRATNERGATGEAAINLTINAKMVTATPTLAPITSTPALVVVRTQVVVATPRPPTPTAISSKHSITITEAQMLVLINTALASSEFNYLTATSVSLQNGQITINGKYTSPVGIAVNGAIVVAVAAKNCAPQVTVVSAQVGQFAIPDSRKAQISAAIEKAITSAVAQSAASRCIESLTIANGVMTMVYR